MTIVPSRRQFLKAGGALVIVAAAPSAFGQAALPRDATGGRPLANNEVDAFFAIHGDGSVTLFSGKVDIGTGLRIAYGRSSRKSSASPSIAFIWWKATRR